MAIFEPQAPPEPTVQQGAARLRRTLSQTFQQIEASLALVRQIVQRHGRSAINSALGGDATPAATLYGALKDVVEDNKPGTSIPDLPS